MFLYLLTDEVIMKAGHRSKVSYKHRVKAEYVGDLRGVDEWH